MSTPDATLRRRAAVISAPAWVGDPDSPAHIACAIVQPRAGARCIAPSTSGHNAPGSPAARPAFIAT
ncbi:hypothetical protein QTN93_07410 [Sphingomonas aerolata]|uniref:hypothetical protein n=1 Tax=Sphingomonas aerolata TaxID=185951 RepID=UPI0035A5E958